MGHVARFRPARAASENESESKVLGCKELRTLAAQRSTGREKTWSGGWSFFLLASLAFTGSTAAGGAGGLDYCELAAQDGPKSESRAGRDFLVSFSCAARVRSSVEGGGRLKTAEQPAVVDCQPLLGRLLH